MKISKCYIDGFGRFRDFEFEFKDGLNIVMEENGWGKTTFSNFLKAMFYGMEYSPNKRKGLLDRVHYMPWDGGVFGGSMEFETEEGRFRIERTFGKSDKDDTLKVIDLTTGRETDDFSDPIGESIFGVDRDSFEKSIFIAQSSMETGITDRINSKVGNLSETKDDLDVFEAASDRIETEKKRYTSTSRINPGELTELKNELGEMRKNAEEIPVLEDAFKLQKNMLDDRLKTLDILKADKEKLQKEILEQSKASETIGTLKEKREHYNKNIKQLEELDAFFAKGIPDSDRLAEKEKTLQTYTIDRRSLDAKNREALDREENEKLKELFSEKLPDDDEILRWQNAADRLKELRMKRENSRLGIDDEKELKELKEFFKKGRPSTESISEAMRQMGRVHALEGEENTIRNNVEKLKDDRIRANQREAEKTKGVGGFFFAIILLLLVTAAVFVFVLNGYESHLIGLAAAALAAVLFAADVIRRYNINARNKKRSYRMEREEEENNKKLEDVVRERTAIVKSTDNFLNLYLTKNKVDSMERLSEIQRNLDRLENLEKLENNILDKNSDALLELSEKQLALYTELQGYARSYDMDLFSTMCEQRLLKQLSTDAEKERTRRKLEGDVMLLTNRINDKEKELTAFLESFPFDESEFLHPGMSEEEKYHKKFAIVKSNMEKLQSLQEETEGLVRDIEMITEDLPKDGMETEIEIDDLQERARDIDEKIAENMNFLQKDRETLNETSEKLIARQDEKDRMTVLEEQEKSLANRVDILVKAKEYLQKARDNFMAEYMGPLQKGMEKYMALIYPEMKNAGKKTSFELDMDLKIHFRSGSRTVDSNYLSEGYQDMASLSVRLALVDAMYEKEQPAIIMDDPFSGFDKDKVESGLSLLKSLGDRRQIIYFTCHPSRAQQ